MAMKKISRATSARRLLKLADFLDELPSNRFYYGHWAGNDWEGAPDLSCGTTACALGWATVMPTFRRLGLRMIKFYDNEKIVVKGKNRNKASNWHRSAMLIFGLTYDEAAYLFIPNSPKFFGYYGDASNLPDNAPHGMASSKVVARHIRRFVKVCRA